MWLSLEYTRYYDDDRTHRGLNETPRARSTGMRPLLSAPSGRAENRRSSSTSTRGQRSSVDAMDLAPITPNCCVLDQIGPRAVQMPTDSVMS